MNVARKFLPWLTAAAVLGAVGYVVRRNVTAHTGHTDGRRVAFYQDSMHPWIKSNCPGKCTICAMDLTPIYEGDKGFAVGGNTVVLNANNITVLNVQTEAVKRRPLIRMLRVAGTLEANEARKTIVTAPAPGRIRMLAVDSVGAEVQEGQTLISLFSPELLQKRLYFKSRAPGPMGPSNDLAQTTATADPFSSELVAPLSGVVVERKVFAGQFVNEGDPLLTIVDPSVLWFRFDVYEQQLAWIEVGQTVQVTVPAMPGRVFAAVIAIIEPALNDTTRTVKVRADIGNPAVSANGRTQRLLRFGLYAEGRVRAETPNVLAVPRSSILFPGGSAHVYVDQGDGAYNRRFVTLGRQGDERWEVLQGLEAGDRVVTAGNVLLDAQAQISQELKPEPACTEQAAATPMPASSDDAAEQTGTWAGAEMRSNGTTPMATSPAREAGVPGGAPATPGGVRAHREMVDARMNLRDEMRMLRAAALAEAQASEAAVTNAFTGNRHQALSALVTVADGVGQALATDDLGQFNRQAARWPAVLAFARTELTATPLLSERVRHLTDLGQGAPAPDLAEARRRFLPFSAAMVDLAKQLRKDDPAFGGLKIFHCPMAPKPGLWLQNKGPLANPFYGAEMPKCGEEIHP